MRPWHVVPVLALAAGAAAQADLEAVEIKAVAVQGRVWMLEGAGGNIGVSAGPDGVLIVDDQFAPLADRIRAALARIAPGKLRFVLNTHWHGDHTGGNRAFGAEAPIVAHSNVRKRLAVTQELRGRTFAAQPAEALPVVTFDDALSLHFNGEEIQVMHLPKGHTDGDAVVHFTGSKVLHMGDHFFAGRFPFVDLESGGDVEGYTGNVELVLGRIPEGTRIIPGHGPLSGSDELRLFLRMLKETTAVVRAGMTAGKSLEQIRQAGLQEEWQAWGSEFVSAERWIDTIHASLSRGERR